MLHAPAHPNEAERLADLRALEILDTPPEERFDRIVSLARRVFDVPIAYIALIDATRQWFKSKIGLKVIETGRDVSFCGHTIHHKGPTIVPDATRDARFADNPLVVGEPHIRFYAGHPLRGPNGHNVGTLCLADRRPRSFDDGQVATLRELAALAEHELHMVDVIQVQRKLLDTQKRLEKELAEAAEYVQALLPPRLDGQVATDWQFLASSKLGGDLFGYHWQDNRRLVLYLLDVCGHGVGAALFSTSICSALRAQTLPGARFDEPGEVLAALNRAFPMDQNNNKFFTAWYGVYDAERRQLCYSTAGHPPALLFNGSRSPLRLGGSSMMIGIEPDAVYRTECHDVEPGSRLYVFSDGVFEVPRAGAAGRDRLLMLEGLIEVLARSTAHGGSRVEQARREIERLQGSATFADDFSLVEFEFK
jgi:sigma-B regulation protein RsbU (phosphoserine phosphatase)